MNGRENSTAGALLFALISIGALIKGDELMGIAVGAICAIISAIMLKQSIMQAASEQEDNHQRIEIQFQQLRNKIGDSGGSSNQQQSTMLAITHTMTDSTEAIQESLQNIHARLSGLDELPEFIEKSAEISNETSTAFKMLSEAITENAKATQELLKKMASNTEAQAKLIKVNVEKMSDIVEKITHVDENSKKITELTESGQTTTQTGLKLMQVIGQMLKSPPFAKDITQLSTSMNALSEKLTVLEKIEKLDKLEELSNKIDEMKTSLSEPLTTLTTSNNDVVENTNLMSTSIVQVSEVNKNIAEQMTQNNENVTSVKNSIDKSTTEIVEMVSSLQDEISKLTMKIDAYNGLMKASLEQYSTLSEQDVKVLEKIAEKVQ